MFTFHLIILKFALCQPKKVRPNEVWVPRLFFTIAFDLQRFLFVLTMKTNVKLVMQKPFDINEFIKLWKILSSSQILEYNIPKCIRLVEFVVQLIGSIENE